MSSLALLALPSLALLVFIVGPLLALAGGIPLPALAAAGSDGTVWSAVALSLCGATLAAAAGTLLGVPLGYLLARHRSRWRALLEAIVDLPLSIPHTVVGIALLLFLSRRSLLGRLAQGTLHFGFYGTLAGVVAAMLYVSVPYVVSASRDGFLAIDRELEETALTFGAGPLELLWYVLLPLGGGAIASGVIQAWSRAISEIGAVIILAYYPVTAPVKIFDLFLQYGIDRSGATAALLLAVVLSVLASARWVRRRWLPHAREM